MFMENDLPCKLTVIHNCEAAAMCSIGEEVFTFKLQTVYIPDEQLLEFVAYEAWIRMLTAEGPTTIEALAASIFDVLFAQLDPIKLDVHIDAETPVHGDVAYMWLASSRCCRAQ